MRYLFGFLCVCALGVVPLVGCGQSLGPMTEAFPCTDQGIRDAIAEGGGPHTFDCDGLTTVITAAEIVIDNDVILDGEGKLTIDGNQAHAVFAVSKGVTAELRGLSLTRGSAMGGNGGGLRNEGTLTLDGTTVLANTATDVCDPVTSVCSGGMGGGINNAGTLTLISSTVSGNSAEFNGGGIHSTFHGTMTVMETTVSGNIAGTSEQYRGRGGGIESYGTLTLTESTVTGNAADFGGGISSLSGATTLTESTVSSNAALLDAGGIHNDNGTMTLVASVVMGNTAERSGGGIMNSDSKAFTGPASTTLINSTVTGNSAAAGGGISNEGVLGYPGTTVTLTNTTVSGNTARNASVAHEFAGQGGGIRVFFGSLQITNSTVSGNIAETSGGGIDSLYGWIELTNTTLSRNAGGALRVTTPTPTSSSLTVARSLVDGHCEGDIVSAGYNVESPADTCGFDQDTDRVLAQARLNLGPLADNGGSTLTHKPGAGDFGDQSDAIDWIPADACLDAEGMPLTMDQRGLPRPVAILGPEPKCDVGSVEVQASN